MGRAILILLASGMTGPDEAASTRPGAPPTPHRAMRALNYGDGPRSYWLFEPTDPPPEGPAPVVVLLHGWMSTNPGLYGAWIAHLTRRGNVVVFPRYQEDWTTRPAYFLPNALDAIQSALVVMDGGDDRVRPDRDRFALIGHSAGGNLATQLAALAPEVGLPTPRALVAVLPGEVLPASGPDLSRIPSETALVVVASQEDMVVGDVRARQIFRETSAIPPEGKQYIFLRSDRSADPPLIADHAAPTSALPWLDTGEGPLRSLQMSLATVDRLDTVVLWQAADLAMEAGFSGRPLDELTLAGDRFRALGQRPDGRPIRPPLIGDDLATIPRVAIGNGMRLVPWPTSVFDQLSRPERVLGLDLDVKPASLVPTGAEPTRLPPVSDHDVPTRTIAQASAEGPS